jgi:hypothetical protein
MDKKKLSFLSIFLFLAINVVSLVNVIEGYYGREYGHVYTFMFVALISTALATAAFFIWRKEEYKR